MRRTTAKVAAPPFANLFFESVVLGMLKILEYVL